jgi:hypothetical protein
MYSRSEGAVRILNELPCLWRETGENLAQLQPFMKVMAIAVRS